MIYRQAIRIVAADSRAAVVLCADIVNAVVEDQDISGDFFVFLVKEAVLRAADGDGGERDILERAVLHGRIADGILQNDRVRARAVEAAVRDGDRVGKFAVDQRAGQLARVGMRAVAGAACAAMSCRPAPDSR